MDAIAQLTTALEGRYAVEKEIGRGGMATVYLARDVRHNRKVALKVLNPELGAVLGVERFLSEIQVTANLQHPNLLPLFDSGEANGLLFYVMPYVEGESLRAKLQREKQLPIDEALHVGTAVLSALDYAHRHGVIHRDLKPENILIHDGQPLVADFGIALAVSNAGGNRITQTGLSLGTPQYMSPEQATGDREIDGRTDVYSLGAVLYEMLTGEPPHDGKTSQAIIAKVLTDRPRSIRLARDTVPAHVEAAVDRALAKLPADRYHSAREFADALAGKAMPTEARAVPVAGEPVRRAPGRRLPAWTMLLSWATTVAALAVAGVGWGKVLRTEQGGTALRFELNLVPNTTLNAGLGVPVAIAPAARAVAYVGVGTDNVSRLYLRSADDLQARLVPNSDRARFPVFSPDGESIVFWADGQIRKAPVHGGPPNLLTDVGGASRMAWSKAGLLVTSQGGRLATIAATGGAPRPFTQIDSAAGETSQLAPAALDDGKHVLYTSLAMGGPAASRIGVALLEDGSTRILDVRGSFALGMLDGYLLYTTAGGSVMAVRVDEGSWQVRGDPVPVIDQVSVQTGTVDSYIDMAPDGALVYVSGLTRRQLVFTTGADAVRPILPDAGSYGTPRLSPDGRRLAVTVSSSGRSDVYVYELPAGPLVRLTTEGSTNDRPEWLPDSRTVIYRSNRGKLNAVWAQPIDGSGSASMLFGLDDAKIDEAVMSPDGRYLLFQRDRAGRGEQWYRAMQGGDSTPRRVGSGAFGEVGGRFSPDGKWVVYASSESGTSQIYVRPFPSLGARYQISLSGGVTPLWSPDGRRILYVAGRDLVAATIGGTQPFSITARQPVLRRGYTFNNIHADYDVARDGRTFVALKSPDQDVQLVVVHNWRAELRARLRGAVR